MYINFTFKGVTAHGYLSDTIVFSGLDDFLFVNISAPTIRETWKQVWRQLRIFIRNNNVIDDDDSNDFPANYWDDIDDLFIDEPLNLD